MKKVVEYLNKQLILKGNDYYIRFNGGQYVELPCDIKITKEEADIISVNPTSIADIFNEYRGKMPWTINAFIKSGLEDYFVRESYSKDTIEKILDRLDKYERVKYEMYESIMLEEFPISGLEQVSGKTAKNLQEERGVSMGEAYLLLLDLIEQQEGQ